MGKKVSIILLAMLTMGLGIVAVMIAVDLNNRSSGNNDVSVQDFDDYGECRVNIPNYDLITDCKTDGSGQRCTCNNTAPSGQEPSFSISCSANSACGGNNSNNSSPQSSSGSCTAGSSLCSGKNPGNSCGNGGTCAFQSNDGGIGVNCACNGQTPSNNNSSSSASRVCTPFQWFGCGYSSCSSGQAARCNAEGSGYDCFDDPSSCGGGSNNPNPNPNPNPTPNPTPPPGGQSSSQSASSQGAGTCTANESYGCGFANCSNGQLAICNTSGTGYDCFNSPSSCNDVNAGGEGNLPSTGILDEQPWLVIGVTLILVGAWFSWIRVKHK